MASQLSHESPLPHVRSHVGDLGRAHFASALSLPLLFLALYLLDEYLEVVVHVDVGEAVEDAVVGHEQDLSQLPDERRAS